MGENYNHERKKNMDKYWIWFSRINKIGAGKQNELLRRYTTPENIWKLNKKQLQECKILTTDEIEIICNQEFKNNIEIYERYMNQKNIKMITFCLVLSDSNVFTPVLFSSLIILLLFISITSVVL